MMKQILRKACLVLLGGILMSTSAWGQETAGSYTYFLDFETVSGTTATASQGTAGYLDATIKGSGQFTMDADAQFNRIFKNAMGGMRTNYLLLPTDVLSHSADSKELTIAFWVNRSEQTADYFHCPIFTAYAEAPNNGNGEPMLRCAAKGEVQLNVSSTPRDEGWCDFGDALNVKKSNKLSSEWLDDSKWHYYTITLTETSVKVYVDGVIFNEWHLDNASAGQKITRFFTEGSKYTYICLGGNQAWDWKDKDPGFTFDDLYITNKALTAGEINYRIFSKNNSTFIADNKGDLTSIINGTFEENAEGWSGGQYWNANWTTRSWRGTSQNGFYEANASNVGPLTYSLENMPAGTYKVVAATHGFAGCTITPRIAGTSGTTYTLVGDQAVEREMEINTNGVEMPYNSLGGFTTNDWGHRWHWITATGTLSENGTLTISFAVTGNNWVAIDDVHLYCTSLNGTSYTRTVGDNGGTINADNYVVTADIILSNPNTVLRTTGRITTAAGEYMNNDQYKSGEITKLVLYDGYDFAILNDNVIANLGAVLYRSIAADTWSTLCVPFWPTTSLTMKYPAAYSDGTLTFSDVERTTWGGVDKPMLIKSSTALTKIEGVIASVNGHGSGNTHNTSMTSGAGAPMHGVYSAGYVPTSTTETTYYVVGTDNNLHKVDSEVSIAPFRAYFELPASNEAPALINLSFDGEGTTGISPIDNAQTKIEKVYYDLSGRRVAQPTKGLYIVNGKKVIIK